MAAITKSIGTSSRDYSTITLWEAALGGAAGGAGNDAIGECYNDSAFDEIIVINDATPDSIKLTSASGEEHDGTAGSGVRLVRTSTTTDLVTAAADGTDLSWIEFDANEEQVAIFISFANYTVSTQNCIIHNCSNNEAAHAINSGATAKAHDILNNIIYNIYAFHSNNIPAEGIVAIANANNTKSILNNTLYNIKRDNNGVCYGINFQDDADDVVKNNIVCTVDGGSTTELEACFNPSSPSTAVVSHNLSSDATASGTGSLINKAASNQFVSIVGGSEDLHLKTGADAIGAGTDLGTTPTGVNIDIDGRDRDAEGDTWDIGAHQFVSETQLPNKLIVPLSDNTVSFIGKKVNSGSVITRAGSASLTNSGKEGLNALLAAIVGPQALKVLGQKGTAGAAIISQILDDQEVSAAGKSGINGAIDQTLSDMVLEALGQKGATGAIATSLDIIVSLLGFESQVIFSGVIDSSLGDNALSTIGNTGATGSVLAQLGNLVALLTGAAGHTGDMSVNILTGVELLAKIGVTGVMDIRLLDNEVRMIEITVSDKIYQILISTKTGQIKILAPKTGSMDISTQQ